MRSFYYLIAIFVFQLVVMAASYSLDPEVYEEVLMVLFIVFLLILGAGFALAIQVMASGGLLYNQKRLKHDTLRKLIAIMLGIFLITFFLKLAIYSERADFSSYKALRESFLVSTFGFIGAVNHVFMYMIIIFSGALLGNVVSVNRPKAQYIDVLIASLGFVVPVFFMGSRSSVLLFGAAFLLTMPAISEVIRSKFVWISGSMVIITLLILGVVRGIPVENRVIPLDSFIVGPHLLHKNRALIEAKAENLERTNQIVPGYALFSGFYVILNDVSQYLNLNVFQNHLERMFWERHRFMYIEKFGKEYNSYYTAALSVVIEGWWQAGILSFLLGFIGFSLKNYYARLIFLSMVMFFSISVFKVSVFQSQALSLLLVVSVSIELFYRMRRSVKGQVT